MGFGVDAHSMLISAGEWAVKQFDSLRRTCSRNTLPARPSKKIPVSTKAALEETFFLRLRLAKGVDLKRIARDFGEPALSGFTEAILDCVDLGLLEREADVIRLTGRGRLLSNEVFERFILCGSDTPVRRR